MRKSGWVFQDGGRDRGRGGARLELSPGELPSRGRPGIERGPHVRSRLEARSAGSSSSLELLPDVVVDRGGPALEHVV